MNTSQQLKLIRNYARTFLEALESLGSSSEEKRLVCDQVSDFLTLLAEEAHLWQCLRSNIVADSVKQQLLDSLGKQQKWHKTLSLFLSFLLAKKRINLLRLVLEKYLQLYREKAGILTLRIASSVPLTKRQKLQLAQAMQMQFKAKDVFFQPDEPLSKDRGMIIFTNKGCIDRSMRSVLSAVKTQLLQA